MKRKYTLLSGLIMALLFYGCGADYYFKKADNDYEYMRYSESIDNYEKGLEKRRDSYAVENLANAFFFSNQLKKAKPLYEEVIQNNQASAQANFNYGRLLMYEGHYKEAITYFEFFLKDHPGDVVAEMLIASCLSINQRFRDTSLYVMTGIPSADFTGAFSPIAYQNGVVFAAESEVFQGRKQSPWTGNSYLDLYYMEKDNDGNWLSPVLLEGDINGRFHEGPATFSEDGSTVYFTRSNYYKRKMNVNEAHENNLKIFKASLVEDKWTNLEELPFNSDDYSCGHPSITPDGKTMYFVSDMPGGYGGTDVYRTTLENGQWSSPENLGPVINTAGNELFPYIHSDGTLYFSSNAHNSMGGLDVFLTYYYNNRWMKPENLNYPLNTTSDDFGYVLNTNNITGFVSSSRTDKDELYAFEKKPPVFNLYGMARKKGTDIPVEGVTVEITVGSSNDAVTMVSGKDGKFHYKLNPEEEYHLLCTKIGCFTRTDKISTIGLKYSENFYADFEVEEIILDKPIVLENIYYDFDKWAIRPDAAAELDKLVKLLKDNPTLYIEMGSHTDARGTDNYNLVLSDKRAKAAVDYLVSRGIDPKRLTWKGYGETVPVNECVNKVTCDEDKHQQNRRTEFKVTKK
ncbi:MAG: OmpA family protein [Bacteroidetes bacterium]|nr:OmpA family protein [Bacteroidota bacterium]